MCEYSCGRRGVTAPTYAPSRHAAACEIPLRRSRVTAPTTLGGGGSVSKPVTSSRRYVAFGASIPTVEASPAAWIAALISPPSRGGTNRSRPYSLKSATASGGSSSASVSGATASISRTARNTLAGWSCTTLTSSVVPTPLWPGRQRTCRSSRRGSPSESACVVRTSAQSNIPGSIASELLSRARLTVPVRVVTASIAGDDGWDLFSAPASVETGCAPSSLTRR